MLLYPPWSGLSKLLGLLSSALGPLASSRGKAMAVRSVGSSVLHSWLTRKSTQVFPGGGLNALDSWMCICTNGRESALFF